MTPFITHKKKSVVVFGSGPIRIGQGIEFDYASVHCVHVLKELGFEVIMSITTLRLYRQTLIRQTDCILNR